MVLLRYRNLNSPDCDAGVIHWYLKLNLKEPLGVTVFGEAVCIEYDSLTDTEKARLDKIMSEPITLRPPEILVGLDAERLKEEIEMATGSAVWVSFSEAGIIIKTEQDVNIDTIKNALKEITLDKLMRA